MGKFITSIFRRTRDPWGDIPKPWWLEHSKLDPPAAPYEVLALLEHMKVGWMFFQRDDGQPLEPADYDRLIRRLVRGESQ